MWVLIIFVYATIGQPTVALTSIPMVTEAACQAAGVRAVQEFGQRREVRFVCARNQ